MDKMKILIPCEFSGIVREAFRKRGHDAWSCDLLETEIPGQHIKGDVLNILNDGWDMMIAFPPCTYLTTTANRSFLNNPGRWKKRLEAMIFVYHLMNADIEKIAIENPVGVISSHIRKPDQIIQPYEFGHPVSKRTCLWLKNLPELKSTDVVEPEWINPKSGGKRMSKTHYKNGHSGGPGERSKNRSRTYQGIADAMANQWNF